MLLTKLLSKTKLRHHLRFRKVAGRHVEVPPQTIRRSRSMSPSRIRTRQKIDRQICERADAERQYAFIHFVQRRVIRRSGRRIDALFRRSKKNKKSGCLRSENPPPAQNSLESARAKPPNSGLVYIRGHTASPHSAKPRRWPPDTCGMAFEKLILTADSTISGRGRRCAAASRQRIAAIFRPSVFSSSHGG